MLRRSAFENDAVAWRTANPSPFGYHHGPVPYWHQQQLASASASANTNDQAPPFPPVTLSKVNTGVCDVEVDGTGTMCGTVFRDQPSLRRHLRDAHPGAAHNPTRVNITIAERLEGENAIKRWVLTGGWRGARYIREPGRGPEGGLVALYADACERIAREDEEFRAKFGGRFRRGVVRLDPGFRQGRHARARPRVVGAAEAAATAAEQASSSPPPPRAGRTRSARPRTRQVRRDRVLDLRAQDSMFISDGEEDEDDCGG